MAAPLGVTLAAVLQHLQILEASGIIRTEKAGRIRTCHLEPSGLTAAEQWFEERRSAWGKRFDRLERLLEDESEEPPSS